MSDRQLEDKFRDQAMLVLPLEQVNALITLCWKIDEIADCRELTAAATLSDQSRRGRGSARASAGA